MSAAGLLSTLLRVLTAALLATAGVLVSGLPAAAEVTAWTIQSPPVGGIIAFAEPLIVDIERAASPPEEKVEVRTRMLNEAGEPVSETIVALELTEREERDAPGSDRLRYTGTIDPDAFAWLDGAIAPNGQYTLQVQVQINNRDMEREPSEWRNHPLVLDAQPQPATAVQSEVRSVEKKRLRVSWESSPTPDISHYILERRVDGGPWGLAQDNITADVTQVTDAVDVFGDYRYRVIAARRSGDGSGQLRMAESDPSATVELEPEPEPVAPPVADDTEQAAQDPGPARPATPTRPRVQAPVDANQTYKGPLDYGVEAKEVTERVPIKVAKGGGTQEGGVLEVVDRSVDPQRILPAVAGGLILVLSAAHVVRFLNE